MDEFIRMQDGGYMERMSVCVQHCGHFVVLQKSKLNASYRGLDV